MTPQPNQHNLSMPKSMEVEQLKGSLAVSQAELGLWEAKFNAMKDHGKRERGIVQIVIGRLLTDATPDEKASLKRFLDSHKTLDEAELQLVEMNVAKLKAQCEILKAAIDALLRADAPVVQQPGKKIVIPGM